MKIRKGIVTTIIFIFALIMSSILNSVQAATVSPSLYYGIVELRNDTGMGFALNDPSNSGKKIWKMVKYSNATTNTYTEESVYCLNSETGFSNAGERQEYTLGFNMKTESSAIASQNTVLGNLVNGGQYKNVLALGDLMYVKGVSSASDRQKLLDNSGANKLVQNGAPAEAGLDLNDYYLNDDEIDAVQQAAIWYFTNGQSNSTYNVYGTEWTWYTTASLNGTYKNYSSYNPNSMSYSQLYVGTIKKQQMAKLYDYLVDTAKTNASANKNDPYTILTLYASGSDVNAQPVMEVTKLPKEFDLSLRKYITEVNGTSVSDTRTPNIDTSTLNTGTTATYKHRKDPVEVKTNDIITYNITIYNEGAQEGRATKIVDQLPTGVEFQEVVSGNFEKSSYSTTNNTLYLTRKSNNSTNLSAYSSGELSSETIVIKCKVTATGGDSDKILTNLAWISEEVNEEGTVITTQADEDRDSEPSTITTKTKDELVTTDNGYIGSSSNSQKDLTNSSNYFVGQQDDDDFEKLVIRAVTSVKVSKVWDDSEDQDGIRASSVTVKLLKNGVETGQSVTLSADNQWNDSFDNLPTKENGQDITYSVQEITTINGYSTVTTNTTNSTGKSYTITNSYIPQTTSITAKKVWSDSNNQDNKRPSQITFQLYKKVGTGTESLVTSKTLSGTGNEWSTTFTNLPVYENGQKITYTVRETVPSGYTSSGDGTEANNYTITNTYSPEETQITVTKKWEDNNNQDGKRPTSVTVELYKNGVATGNTQTISGSNWTATFTGLPVYENGQKITYTVRETVPSGYTSSGDGTEANNYTITNTHKIFDLSLRKYITKVGNTDITNRTPNIDTSDLADGTDTTASYNHRKDPVTVKTGDQVIYNLTIYNEGEKVGRATKIVDQLPTGLTYVGLVDDSIFTVGTYDVGTNTIYFIRQDSNTDNLEAYNNGNTLDSETIQVICEVTANAGSEDSILTNVAWISEEYDAEDDKTITTEEKADTDSEPGTAPNVNKDDLVTTGDDIGYKGDNSNPEDLTQEDTYYKGEQDDDDFEKIVIEARTEITAKKIWNDNNNQDNLRPNSINLQLIGTVDSATVVNKTETVTGNGNEWSITFTNLPVFNSGKKIVYVVKETATPEGYSVSGDGTSDNSYTITNTHTPGTTSITINKKWEDGNDQDGLRPDVIEAQILGTVDDSTVNNPVINQTVQIKESEGWVITVSDLPVYYNGKEIQYTIKEITQIDGYTSTVTDDTTTETGDNNSSIDNNTKMAQNDVMNSNILENTINATEEVNSTKLAENNIEKADSNNIKTEKVSFAGKSLIRATSINAQPKSFTITNTHIVKEFDLALRKFIVAVSDDETIDETDILKNAEGTGYAREPVVDASNLNKNDADGNKVTTAIYNHTKEPVSVKKNDIVVYMLRVYNEGEKDGYASEITDYLPSYLEFVSGEYNSQYGWQVSDDGRTVTTRYLENSLIKAPQEEDGNYTLNYVQVPIMCKVSGGATANENITNIADITESLDENKNPTDDRDSEENNVQVPEDSNLPGYKDEEIGQDYVPGQEDDDDFEKIYVQEFDLSLRKYIIQVGNTNIVDRNPSILTASLSTGTTATYNHKKNPVVVKTGDQVIYNLTIYNEGDKDGRATKIVDQLPKGLKYIGLVDETIFTTETYDEDTNTVYFVRQDANKDNLLAYDGGQTLDSETIQVICEVVAEAGNKDSILTNVAWISEEYNAVDDVIITTEQNEDRDSEPGTTPSVNQDDLVSEDSGYIGNSGNAEKDLSSSDEYFEGEQDDDDFEKIVIEARTQITATKVWVDNSNQDALRPTSIRLQLLGTVGDRTIVDRTETVTGQGDSWTITFTDLPVYDNGELVTYVVKEIDTLEGYSVSGDGTNSNDYTITNTHTPGTTSVTINKVWEDENDKDGLRPDVIQVQLLGTVEEENETVTVVNRTIDIKEEENWVVTINDLPVNYNGLEIQYSVTEITQIDGYTSEVTENVASTETGDINTKNVNNTEYADNGVKGINNTTVASNISKNVSETYGTNEKIAQNDIKTTENKINDVQTTKVTYAGKSMIRASSEKVSPRSFTVTNTHIVEDFDLALRKFIVAVSKDENIEESDILKSEDGTSYAREPVVDASKLNTTDEDGNTITTAIYNHTKEPVLVKKNDIVVYMLRVYNEGEQDGYAAEITDYLPPYLEFVDGEYNAQYGWEVSEDGRTVTTRYLENSLIAKPQTEENGNNTLSYVEVPIMCRVSGEANANENITNIADITEYQDENKEPVEDRDSEENNVEVPRDENLPGYKEDEIGNEYIPGQEDDDDFEKVYVQDFDLALRKFISEVDGTQYDRAPSVDLSGLENGTTAIYNHTKDPVLVKRNSVVVYTIRVYNEGNVDGYAEEVTDYLPNELEFLPEHEINIAYEWNVSEDGRTVTTDYLSSEKETEERQNLINAFDGTTLDYKEVKIACRVKDEAETNIKLTNLAEITEDSDDDRDSNTDNVEIPNDENLPNYKDDEIDQDYVPGQEDDDDFEKVIVQDFDLALRKFITKVDEEDVTTRIPEISYDREQNQITYNHTKEPVEVITGNIVEYTIRIYNEGEMSGYAQEVADDIPDGLKYLPQNATNIEYRWVMYDAEGNITENVDEAVEIRTDYLSKEQEETEGENLLQAFNPDAEIGEGNPDYRDIKIAFEVVEPNTSDRIIVNSAQITEDSDENGNPVEDKDSTPDEWNEGEDDQDKEYIKLTYFDLALRKWVTEAIVIENGQQTVTQTGHTAEMDPEPVVKVELYRKNLNDVVVKFRYSIRITNEGDIAGYATEITDYVPAGLTFLAEDNSGWADEGNNVISTRLLENTLLQPGELAEVQVLLTWINGEDNMGQMINIAEISEDYNDKGAPDRDSTPDNGLWGEDDIDDAPVLLSIETGQARVYFVLGFTVLGALALGLVLIKKFVI